MSDLLPPSSAPIGSGDAQLSPTPTAAESRKCAWCREPVLPTRPRACFCDRHCRQAAFRCRRSRIHELHAAIPLRFGYANPPYPGFAKRLYGNEATYRGEVDHAALIASLVDRFDGWALSTGAYALRQVLPLFPEGARVCAWVKPIGVSGKTFGLHNVWEPLIVVPGRRLRPGKRDWLSAQPARHNGTLKGRKPVKFCLWLFQCLGMVPGDSFEDLFPGTGIVSRTWSEINRPRPSRSSRDDAMPLFAE